MKKRCLYCYSELSADEKDYHNKCSRRFFGSNLPPEIDFIEEDLESRGINLLEIRKTVTGVQTKLSLERQNSGNKSVPGRLTITGLSGGFILKPSSAKFPEIAELEDLTMRLADESGIKTVPHSIIRMKSGNLAYITKRIDRSNNNKKIHMEDMCQLTERLTEHKYHGSYEQIAKVIRKFTDRELDIINFAEVVIFSYLTGNSDMHLKNFSLIRNDEGNHSLAPAYDLLPTRLLLKSDEEDLALTLNGKKKKIVLKDFYEFANTIGIVKKVFDNILRIFSKQLNIWQETINIGFISDPMKNDYIRYINSNMKRLFG